MTTGEKNLERQICSIDQRPFYIYGLGYQEPKTAMELGIVSLSFTVYLCHLINKQIKLDRVYYKVLLNLACIEKKNHWILLMADSLVAQLFKKLPAMQETWVQSLGWEDLLEKGMATHSSILAWEIPWTIYQKELDMTEWLSLHFSC